MTKNEIKRIAVLTKSQEISIWLNILILGLISLMLFSYSGTVSAHASLVKAEPARRAVLSVPPKQVRLWFNEEIEGDYASLSVLDANNKALTENKPQIHPDDPKSIFLELPELGEGQYTVKFRVLSVDGHVVDSDFKFTVKNK